MNPYVQVILENVLPIVATVLGVLVTALVPLLALWLKKKFGLDIAVSQQKMLADSLDHGIGLAEQWSAGKLKASEPRVSGAEKLDKALEFVTAQIKARGLEEKSKEELTKLLEARLGITALKAE